MGKVAVSPGRLIRLRAVVRDPRLTALVAVSPGRLIRLSVSYENTVSYNIVCRSQPGPFNKVEWKDKAADTFFIVAVSPGRLIRLSGKKTTEKKGSYGVAVSPGRLIRLR